MITTPTKPWASMRRLIAAVLLGASLAAACDSKNNNGTGPDPEPEPEPQNRAPVASAGPDQTVSATIAVGLDGTGSSDADGDEITYAWSFSSVPQGSGAALSDEGAAQPTFTPDLAGDYVLQLTVSDGTEESAPDAVTITAEDNTASATIGNAGGEIVSNDGAFALSIPDGALAEDVDISATLIPPHQYPDALVGLGTDAVVYDLQPDGLIFAVPARVTFTHSDRVVNDEGQPEIILRALSNFAGDEHSFLDDQLMTADPVSEEVTVSGDIRHFSQTFSTRTLLTTSGPATVSASAIIAPTLVRVFDQFSARVIVDAGAAIGSVESVSQLDASTFVEPVVLDQPSGPTDGRWIFDNTYRCPGTPGVGLFRMLLLVTARVVIPASVLMDDVLTLTHGVEVSQEVECVGTFGPVTGIAFEGGWKHEILGNIEFSFSEEGGATLVDNSGADVAEFDGVPDGTLSIGTLELRPFAPLSDGRLLAVLTDAGVFDAAIPDEQPSPSPAEIRAQPTAVTLIRGDFVVPGITDNTGNTTDGIEYRNDTEEGWVFTQFDDRNLLFLAPDNGAVIVDPNLATAFYDNGTSIFGTDRPVSVFVGPNGFTASEPMLAVTLPDDQSSNGQVLKLDLVGGTAVPTVVDDVFVTGLPRRIRCLETSLYICAVSSIGIPPFGFGSVTFFTWDGQDAFSFIVQRLNPAIGIDLIQDGDRVLVASTDFGLNTYSIDELTADGAYVNLETFDVSADCQGPGHVLFRSTTEVILSCKTNGVVISHVFDAGS